MRWLDLLVCVVGLCNTPARPPDIAGIGTVFWQGDGAAGKHWGCSRSAKALTGTDRIDTSIPAIATRGIGRKAKIPCGSLVMVEHGKTGLRTLAVRLDSGPWGCNVDGKREVLGPGLCRRRGGKRLAAVDLTPPVAKAIGHDVYDKVRVWKLR